MANKKVQQLTAVENKQNDKSKINWKVRVKNKAFWLALIPAVLPYPGYRFGLRLHP